MTAPVGEQPSGSMVSRLLDVLQQAVIVTDPSGIVTSWNAHATRLYGWAADEAIGRSVVELTPASTSLEEAEVIMQRLTRGESWSGEFSVRRKNGTEFTAFVVDSPVLDDAGELVGIVGVSTDVSERRSIERGQRRAAEMATIGRLAGAIAHDFNNLLTVILGHADLTIHRPDTDPQSRIAMQAVYAAATRAAELTRRLHAFSYRQRATPLTLDVSMAVERLGPLLRRLVGDDIDLKTTTPDERLYALIDPSQLDQLLFNLTMIIRDAMRSGELRIELAAVTSPEVGAAVDPAGTTIRLTVAGTTAAATHTGWAAGRDAASNGGDDANAAELAAAVDIVERAGGALRVTSTAGGATALHVFLPRAADPAMPAPTEPAGAVTWADGRTVLIVEDEFAVRTLTAQVLDASGFTVLAADRASVALAIATSLVGTIDLLLTDVMMPGGSGIELAARVREVRPDIAVLFMTGHTDDDVLGHSGLEDAALIEKPFVAAELLAAVGSVLGTVEAPPPT